MDGTKNSGHLATVNSDEDFDLSCDHLLRDYQQQCSSDPSQFLTIIDSSIDLLLTTTKCVKLQKREIKLRSFVCDILSQINWEMFEKNRSSHFMYTISQFIAAVKLSKILSKYVVERLQTAPFFVRLSIFAHQLGLLKRNDTKCSCGDACSRRLDVIRRQTNSELLITWNASFVDELKTLSWTEDEPWVLTLALTTWTELLADEIIEREANGYVLRNWTSQLKPLFVAIVSSTNRVVRRTVLELLHSLLSYTLYSIWTQKLDIDDSLLVLCIDVRQLAAITEEAENTTASNAEETNDFHADIHKYTVKRLLALVPLLVTAITAKCDQQRVSDFADHTRKVFSRLQICQAHEAVLLFIEQDDYFCEFFFSCIVIERLSRMDAVMDSHTLWLTFLENIDWSHEMLLDWIISPETTFLLCMIQYLKLAIADPDRLKDRAKHFIRRRICESSCTLDSIDAELPTLTVTETAGETNCSKCVLVKPIMQRTIPLDTNAFTTTANVAADLIRLFEKLAVVLEKLRRKNLLLFNIEPLLKLLYRFNEVKEKII